ncbi:hypothetical protein WA026_010976 [Henosepilachna vigintioctopunctata]|uniref:TIR domain-containing protein n=1 Tax=Henosepilachna vigintioctopunctata TaxID=420089 RepID=A0AAW1UQN3_9CUCU
MNLEILLMLLNDIFTMGIDISLLDLYSSGFRNNLPIPLLEVVSKSNIRSLVLSRNQFDFIGNNTFPIRMPRLNSIDLSDVSLQMLHEEAFSHIPHLETLLLGKNRLSFFASSKHLSSLTHIDLHENSDAYGSEFILAKSEFHRLSLENLELQHTPLIFLRKPDFANMTQLKNLNLDNCSIVRMDDYVFQDLTSLKYLNLENNKIFYVCKRIPLHIWKGLENLEKLLLGGNGIFQLSAHSLYLFDYLENLKYLGLQRNSLTSIASKDFRSLPKLEVLDLSYNHIISWDDRVFLNNALKEFRGSANKLTYFSEAMLQDFYNLTNIDMNFNSFICDCRVMKKMSRNKKSLNNLLNLVKDQNLLCEKTSNKTLNNFLKNVTNSEINCEKKVSSLVYIIPLSVLFVIAAVIAMLSYRYRWHIRYWAFLVKLYLIRKGKAKNVGRRSTNNFQFDAFVSYCSQDRSFVLNLVQMLENHEPYLKLSVYERDFQVGSVISESIRDHIEKSRKTLLIVSNSYAKSHWCTWETQIAEHHRLFSEKPNGEIVDESIVLIKLGIVEGANLTPTLKYLLKTRIYLQWEDQDDERKVFWQKLRQFLSPREKQISQESLNQAKDSNLSISQ